LASRCRKARFAVKGSLKTIRHPVSSSHLILYPPLSSSKSTNMFWISRVLSSLLNPVRERIFVLLTALWPGRTPDTPSAEGGGTVPCETTLLWLWLCRLWLLLKDIIVTG